MKQLSFLVIEIAGQLAALDVEHVRAVMPLDRIVPVPLAPPTVVGISTQRGRVMTVIDARACVSSFPPPPTHQSVVVMIGNQRYALLVDGIEEVISVLPEALSAPPPALQDEWARMVVGMITLENGRLCLVLNPEYFIGSVIHEPNREVA